MNQTFCDRSVANYQDYANGDGRGPRSTIIMCKGGAKLCGDFMHPLTRLFAAAANAVYFLDHNYYYNSQPQAVAIENWLDIAFYLGRQHAAIQQGT